MRGGVELCKLDELMFEVKQNRRGAPAQSPKVSSAGLTVASRNGKLRLGVNAISLSSSKQGRPHLFYIKRVRTLASIAWTIVPSHARSPIRALHDRTDAQEKVRCRTRHWSKSCKFEDNNAVCDRAFPSSAAPPHHHLQRYLTRGRQDADQCVKIRAREMLERIE